MPVPDESLSEKRAAAGRAGAAARWGNRPRNEAGAPTDDELVCGTAKELRELAEAMEGRDTRTLTRARNISASRVRSFKAEHPNVTNDQLNRRVWCEALPDERPARRPRATKKLRVVNDLDVAELWLYDYIDSWGGSWGISAAEVVAHLGEIDAPQIDVHINSPGGEVFEGIAIKRALAAHPAQINVCIDSLAASIASVIAMAGDTIGIDESAFVMIHDASGFCYGNAVDMLSMADLLDKISGTIAATYATRTGRGSADSWREAMLAETWYTAPEALAAGLADHTLGAEEAQAEQIIPATPVAAAMPLLTAFTALGARQPEPPPALNFLRAVKEAVNQ